jgi:hypothetical protein
MKIKRTTLYAILGELTASGEAPTLGEGKRKDPYRHWKSQGLNSSATTGATTGAADESGDPAYHEEVV